MEGKPHLLQPWLITRGDVPYKWFADHATKSLFLNKFLPGTREADTNQLSLTSFAFGKINLSEWFDIIILSMD